MKKLTRQQTKIFFYLCDGLSLESIAEKLGISAINIRDYHIKILCRNFGVSWSDNTTDEKIQKIIGYASAYIEKFGRTEEKDTTETAVYISPEPLSPTERETYKLLCENKTNREIAEELGLSQIAISKRLEKIYRKLGLCTEDPKEYHTVRRQAILLGTNDNIPSSFQPKSDKDLFSEWDIRKISRELTWYDRDLVNAIMTDLILFLKEDKRG